MCSSMLPTETVRSLPTSYLGQQYKGGVHRSATFVHGSFTDVLPAPPAPLTRAFAMWTCLVHSLAVGILIARASYAEVLVDFQVAQPPPLQSSSAQQCTVQILE